MRQFFKSTDNYVKFLNKGFRLTPIYTNDGFIFIKNSGENIFEFSKIKNHIISQLKKGNFYISNSDKLYLNLTLNENSDKIKSSCNQVSKFKIKINNSDFTNHEIKIINNENKIIKNQNLYNLKKILWEFEIKNNANKFIFLKITSKNNLFALTSPIYLS